MLEVDARALRSAKLHSFPLSYKTAPDLGKMLRNFSCFVVQVDPKVKPGDNSVRTEVSVNNRPGS